MSDVSARGMRAAKSRRRSATGVVAAFGATLFLSALLLFAVQPLFAKMVLPRLGGAPAVWSVAMVFFQAALLVGYAYAHLLHRLAGRAAIAVHAALLGFGLLWLPVAIAPGFEMPPDTGLPFWVIALFAASVGVPFVAVAANAPLLQAWFSRSGHAHARDPYFLYGASNVGSFVALLAYPALIEPLFTLAGQAKLWTAGYVLLGVGIVGCGLVPLRRRENVVEQTAGVDRAVAVGWRDRAGWMTFAFLPSALLVALTAHLSTNIAASPFLWVMPLAVFLLTFVVAFSGQPVLPIRLMRMLLPVALPAAMATVSFPGLLGGLPGIAINLAALFVVALVWHAELFVRRPPAWRLTDFYLCMSAGGVLGGAFTTLLAPVLFSTVLEFPLLLGLSILGIPEMRALLSRRGVWPLAACAAALLVVLVVAATPAVDYRSRNFFGVVSAKLSDDGAFRLLMHGTTVHGAEKLADYDLPRPEPLTYYAKDGPMARGIGFERVRRGALTVGIVGLGAGSLACYSEPRDDWRFFEIDPAVIGVARDPRYFTFLSNCAPAATIVRGDARLTLQGEPDARLDLLVIDAFSSDAIPVHLITAEALRLYKTKVAPDGVVLLHISNRFLELGSVVAATAAVENLAAVRMNHLRPDSDYAADLKTSSEVVALAREPSALASYVAAGWEPLVSDGTVAPWTDDYSNIVGAMLRMQGLMRTPPVNRPASP